MNADDVINNLSIVKELRAALAALVPVESGERFRYPLATAETPYLRYGQAYGSGTHKGKPHPGVDFCQSEGAPVCVVGDGVVTVSHYDEDGYGHYVVVQHKLAEPEEAYLWTLYGHLVGRSMPGVGTVLTKGEVIGYQGTSGNCGPTHLHFECKRTAELSLYGVLNYVTLNVYWYDPYTVLDRCRYVVGWQT